jgi:hypothetical protein
VRISTAPPAPANFDGEQSEEFTDEVRHFSLCNLHNHTNVMFSEREM